MENKETSPIRSIFDALQVRIIRNECRLYMTNNTSEISPIEQAFWYFTTYKNENKKGNLTCYLFTVNNQSAGFGLVRKSSGKYWITGGLKLNQRGKGMGTVLFKDLIENIKSKEVWLEVLSSNTIAQNLYVKLGFKKTGEKEMNGKKIIVMKLSGK